MTQSLVILDDLINLCKKKTQTYNQTVEILQDLFELNDYLESLITRTKHIPRILMAAYGFRDNKYLLSLTKLKLHKLFLEKILPTHERLLMLMQYREKVNLRMFVEVNEIIQKSQEMITTITAIEEIYDKKEKIERLSLRFDENSPHMKYQNGQYYFLDVDKMREKVYRFENWEPWHHHNPVNPEDGDKWPILKEIYAELYI